MEKRREERGLDLLQLREGGEEVSVGALSLLALDSGLGVSSSARSDLLHGLGNLLGEGRGHCVPLLLALPHCLFEFQCRVPQRTSRLLHLPLGG